MDKYPSILDKLALTVESAKLAKSIIVKTEGIGEEINLNMVGWRDDEIFVVCQLTQGAFDDHEERTRKLLECAYLMRQGWQVSEITLVAEAFCSTDADATKGKDLRAMYAEQDSPVLECISVSHVAPQDETIFVAVPYICTAPRKVVYYNPVRHRGQGVLRDKVLPTGIAKMLDSEIKEKYLNLSGRELDITREVLADGLTDMGFEVKYR